MVEFIIDAFEGGPPLFLDCWEEQRETIPFISSFWPLETGLLIEASVFFLTGVFYCASYNLNVDSFTPSSLTIV